MVTTRRPIKTTKRGEYEGRGCSVNCLGEDAKREMEKSGRNNILRTIADTNVITA